MQMKSRFLIPSKQTEFRSFFVCYCFANIIRTFVLLSVLREMSNSSLSCAVAMVCQFISCFHITCSSIPNIIATNSIHIYGYKSSDQIQLNWNIKRISHTHALALHPLCVYWKLLSSFDFSLCLHIITHTHAHAFSKKIQINTIAPNYLLITVSIRLSFVYLQQSSSCFLLFLWLFALPFDLAPNFGVIHSIFNIAILICSKFR